jgi:PhnB protein
MTLGVFLFFDGKCREALEFYATVFKQPVPETLMTYAQDPSGSVPESDKDRILYADLFVLGSNLMLSDCPSGFPFVRGNSSSVVIGTTDADELRRIFEMLQDGGTVHMELQETFFSELFGMVTDKFGVMWQVFKES